MLPEDDQRGPARVRGGLGGRQGVLDGQPREVQIALLIGDRGLRITGRRRTYLLTRRRRCDQVLRGEQVILVRLADNILAVGDRENAIVEHRGRPLLADHGDVAALARDFLRYRVQPDQPPLESVRAVQIQDRPGALR